MILSRRRASLRRCRSRRRWPSTRRSTATGPERRAQAFAATCNIRMQNAPAGGVQPARAKRPPAACRRRCDAGPYPGRRRRPPPDLPLPRKRHPGAPLRATDPARARPGDNPRLDALRRELAVISLRMWLAGLAAGDKRVRAEYVRWQVGSDWTTASSLGRHRVGSFAELKREASDENARVRLAAATRSPTRPPAPTSSAPKSKPSAPAAPFSQTPSRSLTRCGRCSQAAR